MRVFQVSAELLGIYRERGMRPDFWAEPLNAMTNGSFLFAAMLALHLANRRRLATPLTLGLIGLACIIGVGSFLFHTVPNGLTMWLDVGPIGLFQLAFLWLASRRLFGLTRRASCTVVAGIVGSSFALFPLYEPLNGSLFYLPTLLAMLTAGALWVRKAHDERYLLLGAGCCFALALVVRTIDWTVPWPIGTHFIWHGLNGAVVYLVLRTWICALHSVKLPQSVDGTVLGSDEVN